MVAAGEAVPGPQRIGAEAPFGADPDRLGPAGAARYRSLGTIEFLVDAVQQFLDALKLERVHLVGHSLGGLVAASLTLRSPGRARSLTR